MNPLLLQAKDLADTEPDESMRLCNQVMDENPESTDSHIALFMSGYLMMQAERFGIAYHIYQRCAQLRPDKAEIWSNMGMCLENINPKKAIEFFDKAFELDPNNAHALANKGLMCLQLGMPQECINFSNRALKIDPSLRSAKHNKGLAKLMLRDWSGWGDYVDTMGVKHREKRDYGLPEWDGSPGQVLVYGEQGIGDEIMFASCLPDLEKSNSIVFDCDKRLEGIFKRSFDFPIYGTRFKKQTPILDHYKPDYQCAIGQLPFYFRKKDSDFPGSPYLEPDPERVKQWDCVLSDKPRIGIAWNGGLLNTGEKFRSTNIDNLKPLFNLDAEFVNLEYKPVDQDKMDEYGIKNWPRAVLKGCDIEETFALIANLDVVVTVCTSVVYMAGSQGIPVHVMVPDTPSYRYHLRGTDFLWHKSVKLHRGSFDKSIKRIIYDLKDIHRLRSKRNDCLPCAV